MRRGLVIFLTLTLLWTLVAQLNHQLAPLHLYIFAGGLFVAYSGLVLPWRDGLLVVLAAGMLCDANSGAGFGTQTLLFAAVGGLLFYWRDRLPHEHMAGRIGIVLVANFALFFLLSFLEMGGHPSPSRYWPRLGIDLMVSQLFILLIVPWFFALQNRALLAARADPERLI